jgi:hypothetical protein
MFLGGVMFSLEAWIIVGLNQVPTPFTLLDSMKLVVHSTPLRGMSIRNNSLSKLITMSQSLLSGKCDNAFIGFSPRSKSLIVLDTDGMSETWRRGMIAWTSSMISVKIMATVEFHRRMRTTRPTR